MKVKIAGACRGPGPDGRTIMAWDPGQIVDIDDRDTRAVAFYSAWVDRGVASLVDSSPDTAPPKTGSGSGRANWAAYAADLDIEVTDDMSRDDIIAAVEEATK